MKLLSLILLACFVTLFIVPCSDTGNSIDGLITASEKKSHTDNQDKEDNCPPLCQCTCCSVSITSYQFNRPDFENAAQVFSDKKVVIADCSFVSYYSGNIWNPPRFNA